MDNKTDIELIIKCDGIVKITSDGIFCTSGEKLVATKTKFCNLTVTDSKNDCDVISIDDTTNNHNLAIESDDIKNITVSQNKVFEDHATKKILFTDYFSYPITISKLVTKGKTTVNIDSELIDERTLKIKSYDSSIVSIGTLFSSKNKILLEDTSNINVGCTKPKSLVINSYGNSKICIANIVASGKVCLNSIDLSKICITNIVASDNVYLNSFDQSKIYANSITTEPNYFVIIKSYSYSSVKVGTASNTKIDAIDNSVIKLFSCSNNNQQLIIKGDNNAKIYFGSKNKLCTVEYDMGYMSKLIGYKYGNDIAIATKVKSIKGRTENKYKVSGFYVKD